MVCYPHFKSGIHCISKVNWSILIRFHVKHHQAGGKQNKVFGLVGTLVAMATYSCHRLIMGKTSSLKP